MEDDSPTVNEELKIEVEEYSDIDGVRVDADYFEWSIEDSEGNVLETDFEDSSIIYWIPEESGYQIVSVKIGYNGNKSSTAIREVTILDNADSFLNKMVGHWIGTGSRYSDSKEWGIDLYIDSTGHYSGTTDYYSFDPYCESGVFHVGRTNYRFDVGPDSCGPIEEVPCQRIEITNVEEQIGFGTIWIGWTTYINGLSSSYLCNDPFDLDDVSFNLDGNEIAFELNPKGEEDPYWVSRFQLTRQSKLSNAN